MSKAPTIKKRSAWKKFYESYKAYLYLAPAILVMLVFVLYPLVKVFRMGFYTKYNYLTEVGKGFGLKAFEHVLGDPSFQLALKNTLIIFGVGLPISLIIALVMTVVTRMILLPITRLGKAMQRVADGDFSVRLECGRNIGEVVDIYHNFNLMARQLGATETLPTQTHSSMAASSARMKSA